MSDKDRDTVGNASRRGSRQSKRGGSGKSGLRGSARRISVGGMLAALGIVLMYLGSIIDVMDLSAAAFAAILLIPIISEYGRRDALFVYAVTAVLSWLLLPNRSPALMYTVFLGYYPMLKLSLDKLGRVRGTILKLIVLNAAITGAYLMTRLLLLADTEDSALLWAYYPLANLAFLLYDIAIDRIVRLWMTKLRRSFGFGKHR